MHELNDDWTDLKPTSIGLLRDDEIAEADGHRRESSVAAARLLEMAAANAEQLVADARAQADSLIVRALAEAERVTAEADQYRTALLRELAERQADTEARVRSLRRLADEHRLRLHDHFSEQLAQLDELEPEAPLLAVAD